MAEAEHGPSDPFDVNADVCLNCGRPRGEHRFTRGGAACANGRRFKPDMERIREAMRAAESSSPDREGADRD